MAKTSKIALSPAQEHDFEGFDDQNNNKQLQTIKFSVCDKTSSESDTTDVCAEVSHQLYHVSHFAIRQVGVFDHVLTHACHKCRQTDQ